MPLKPCSCDRDKLNRVIDQVKRLSDTVDELREEINSIKICFIEPNSDDIPTNYCEKFRARRDNASGASTLHKLKKYLEKNVIPIITMDSGYSVKKKCQQFFSPSPTTHARFPARRSSRESSIRDSSHISKSNETKVRKSRVKKTSSTSTRVCQKGVCKKSKKHATLASSSSTPSLNKNRDETPSKPVSEMRRGKIIETVNSDLTSLVDDSRIDEFEKNPSKSVKRRRSINSMDKKKKSVAVEAHDSWMSSGILTSATSFDDFETCKIRYKEAKRDYKKKKILRSGSSEKKSKSIQCSPDCARMKLPKSHLRDEATNISLKDLTRNKVCKKNFEEKRLTSHETQTACSKSDEKHENFRFGVRESYCSRKVKTKEWLNNESFTSLTSRCSLTSVDNFFLETKKLEAASLESISKNYCQESVEFGKKRVMEEKRKNSGEEAIFISPKGHEKKIEERRNESESDEMDEEVVKDRKKRTYVISTDMASTKIDRIVQNDFHGICKNLSSGTGDSARMNEENFSYSTCRRKSKKPEVSSRVCQCPNLQKTICRTLPKKREDRYVRKTVCTNRPASKYSPPFPRWSRKRGRSTNDKIIYPRVCGYASSFSRELSPDSCSLILDSDVCKKSHANSTCIEYPRNNSTREKSKNEIKLCSSSEKNVRMYSVCASLSGSVQSISCES